jgi:hypothetical protein
MFSQIRSKPSALPLLVAFVRADHTDDAPSPDDLAILAQLFHGRAHFHIKQSNQFCSLSGMIRPSDKS